jgi:hypothetical protein
VAKITRDTTPVQFTGANLENADLAYLSTTHSSGTVKYTLTVTESGSGLKSLTLSGLTVAGYVQGSDTVTVNGTGVAYTGFGTNIGFDPPLTSSTIVITGDLTSGDGPKTVKVDAAPDVVENVPTLGNTSKSITRDETAPSGLSLAVVGLTAVDSKYYTKSEVTLELAFTEVDSGLKELVFTGNFTPNKVSTALNSGTVIANPTSKTVILPTGDEYYEYLHGDSSKKVYITGTLDNEVPNTVSLVNVVDQMGNLQTSVSPSSITNLVKDNDPPSIESMAFEGNGYTTGTATLNITFTEPAGLNSLTFDADNSFATVTGVTKDGDPIDYTYTPGNDVLKFNVQTETAGSNITIQITGTLPGTLPGDDGEKKVFLSKAMDYPGTELAPVGSSIKTASIIRDSTPPEFNSGGTTIRGPNNAQPGYTSSQNNNTVKIVLNDADEIKEYAFTATSSSPPSTYGDSNLSGSEKVWTITNVDTNNSTTVFLWLKDKAGNPSLPHEFTLIYDSSDPVVGKTDGVSPNPPSLSASEDPDGNLTISGFAIYDGESGIYSANMYEGSSTTGILVNTSFNYSAGATNYNGTVTILPKPSLGQLIPQSYIIEVINNAGRSNTVTFDLTWDGTVFTASSVGLGFIPGAFIDGVSAFAGNTVRRARSGLNALTAAFSGGNRRSSDSVTAEDTPRSRSRINYQSSRERVEAARSPAVESTRSSRQSVTDGSSAGRTANPAPVTRETERINRVPGRENSSTVQPETMLTQNSETAVENLAALSFTDNGSLAPATANQDAGIRGAAFFLAAFILLAVSAVVFMARSWMQVKRAGKEEKE